MRPNMMLNVMLSLITIRPFPVKQKGPGRYFTFLLFHSSFDMVVKLRLKPAL